MVSTYLTSTLPKMLLHCWMEVATTVLAPRAIMKSSQRLRSPPSASPCRSTMPGPKPPKRNPARSNPISPHQSWLEAFAGGDASSAKSDRSDCDEEPQLHCGLVGALKKRNFIPDLLSGAPLARIRIRSLARLEGGGNIASSAGGACGRPSNIH